MAEWFKSWFETDYYNILYDHRDNKEAEFFIQNLAEIIGLKSGGIVLDVGCGEGRHSEALEKLGLDVIGIDISRKRIIAALKKETKGLRFYIHDMRHLFAINYFDAVFSFFTSFGYFSSNNDELKAANSLSTNTRYGGYLVLDYFNPKQALHHFHAEESFSKRNIHFHISRNCDDRMIYKTIKVSDKDQQFTFVEQVRLYTLQEMTALFSGFNMLLKSVYGNYQLEPFDENHSERMILVFQKSLGK